MRTGTVERGRQVGIWPACARDGRLVKASDFGRQRRAIREHDHRRPPCHAVGVGRIGRIEVVCGPMFAGKTEELLRRVRRALIAGRRVVVLNHALDTRHGTHRLASHVGLDFPSLAAAGPAAVEAAVPDGTDVVAIDEAQFFGPGLVPVVERLANLGMTVIVAGLDVTYDGHPFEPLPSLMALAERVDKLTAICSVCGEEAVYHVRVGAASAGSAALVAANVGGTEAYQARCRRHFAPRPGPSTDPPTPAA
jgi:thymidine kinase